GKPERLHVARGAGHGAVLRQLQVIEEDPAERGAGVGRRVVCRRVVVGEHRRRAEVRRQVGRGVVVEGRGQDQGARRRRERLRRRGGGGRAAAALPGGRGGAAAGAAWRRGHARSPRAGGGGGVVGHVAGQRVGPSSAGAAGDRGEPAQGEDT